MYCISRVKSTAQMPRYLESFLSELQRAEHCVVDDDVFSVFRQRIQDYISNKSKVVYCDLQVIDECGENSGTFIVTRKFHNRQYSRCKLIEVEYIKIIGRVDLPPSGFKVLATKFLDLGI